jgi:hypothetical protein
MSAFDRKRTLAVRDFCSANRWLNPIPKVSNPCCNCAVALVLNAFG